MKYTEFDDPEVRVMRLEELIENFRDAHRGLTDIPDEEVGNAMRAYEQALNELLAFDDERT